MEENNTNEESKITPMEEMSDDALRDAVNTQLEKVRRAALLSGTKAICHVILNYIAEFKMVPGKKTFRQQERLIKQIQDFCQTGLSRTINENGEIVPDDKKPSESEEN